MNDARLRCEELLIDRATHDLDAAAREELDALLRAHPEWDDDSFELAASAFDLALGADIEPMPESLRNQLYAQARGWAHAEPAPGPAKVVPIGPTRRGGFSPAWWIAAAAAVIAIVGWWPSAPPTPRPFDARQQLIATANDVVTLPWTATEDLAAVGATGDVVWSESRQEGYMRIRGLEVNDPASVQYQLWVFDAARDDRYPVDGGVFDIVGDEVIVPINLPVPVSQANLFAVTVEAPGGVVVSDRERIVLVASPEDSAG
jgi:hypothetical protein